jgi:uncharacterized membrane protein YfcA
VIDSATAVAVIVAAGFVAGAINGVVGSGTLFTFSALIAIGVPPVAANGTNTTGLFPGSFASSYAYRNELRSRLTRLKGPLIATSIGASLGALLVVGLPVEVFSAVVPWLIASATVMIAIQPLRKRMQARRHSAEMDTGHPAPTRRLWPWTGAVGIYGGYFGAAQGVVLMAVLTWIYDTRVQYSNAAKNLLASMANMVAAVVFIATGNVVWPAAVVLMVSSIAGGYLGARWARRLPEVVLRGMVVAVGVLATTVLVLR